MSANRFDDVILYAPEVIGDEKIWKCEELLERFNSGDRAVSPGALVETIDMLLRAVKKLQSVEYLHAMHDVIVAHLATHANAPIAGSKRREAMEAGVPRASRPDCDCNLCIDGRRALAGGTRNLRSGT